MHVKHIILLLQGKGYSKVAKYVIPELFLQLFLQVGLRSCRVDLVKKLNIHTVCYHTWTMHAVQLIADMILTMDCLDITIDIFTQHGQYSVRVL